MVVASQLYQEFRAYDLTNEDSIFAQKYLVLSSAKYADGSINTST